MQSIEGGLSAGDTGTQGLMEAQCRDAEVRRDSWEHSQGHLSWGGGKLASVLRGEQENSFMVIEYFVPKEEIGRKMGEQALVEP